MGLFRWLFGLPLAAVITTVLFVMMAGLVSQPQGDYPESRPYLDPVIHAKKKDTPIDERKPIRPVIKDAPPDVEIDPPAPSPSPGPRIVMPEKGPVKTEPGDGATAIPPPMIRHTPLYPQACRARNAEGVVLVQFDVTPEGNVVNAQVIETPDPCFKRAVINAVSKWKYPPLAKNGRSTMRYGIIERFNFQLTE